MRQRKSKDQRKTRKRTLPQTVAVCETMLITHNQVPEHFVHNNENHYTLDAFLDLLVTSTSYQRGGRRSLTMHPTSVGLAILSELLMGIQIAKSMRQTELPSGTIDAHNDILYDSGECFSDHNCGTFQLSLSTNTS